jgi:hypothetical protein
VVACLDRAFFSFVDMLIDKIFIGSWSIQYVYWHPILVSDHFTHVAFLKLFQHRTLCLKDGHEGFTVKQIYGVPVVRRVHIKEQ